MRGVGGMATQLTRVNAPSVSRSGQPSQSSTLEQFARSLVAQQLRAVVVDASELGIEGDFYLCEILGRAEQATTRQARATELFEEGWWIVEIQWYKREPDSTQKYKLLPNSTRWLAVGAIIRVDGLKFEGTGGGRRSGVCVLSASSRDVVSACVS